MNTSSHADSLPVLAKPKIRSGRPSPWKKRGLITVAALGTIALLVVLATNLIVLLDSDGTVWNDPADAKHAEVAIVPGAMVNQDGTMSMMLADRVNQAAALYRDGKVEKILVSGDHGQWTYDEPTTMRKALVAQGIPANVIYEDHAGFNTNATMQRARDIFGVSDATVVTQGFHMKRSLFLAQAAGLDANGLTSDLHGYGGQGIKSDIREVLSRTKAVFDLLRGAPVTGGEPVPITGPARASWGPEAPSGTPPAGSPSD
ncbi:MAG TPA: ElyC/SanA/YdcF family protein [Solirubrobacterales bacterium]|nr:YdcF family protein [Solirubrobacterales bacterium]HMU26448.1 ElyC/SanA/YdcF family protein [Solirubrobacterales bacterium]HMW45958.1 ElyC/SanA/YdcF family protein [Solirubrobacterales bacterium]HMX70877.1 ElyC/SanA/YdcF family protein [Solirubrobacterales bacterium]HMY26076.1 ElyC/SanA/YdcF family protein [Solirubrobacterales bacterium]